MPTLLRGAVIALSTAVLLLGIGLLTVAAVVTGMDAVGLVLGALVVCALAVPPLIAGSFASYWSWDGSARTRLRIWMVVLLVVQVVGAVGAVLLTAGSWPLLIGAIVLVVLSAGLDPACVALGRAARRIELREQPRVPVPTGFDARAAAPVELEAFSRTIRSGWRGGALGGGIGLVAGALLMTLMLVIARGRPDAVLQAASFLPGGAGLGASIGMVFPVLLLSRRVRDLLGGDYAGAQRIGRAVAGRAVALTPEDSDRAAVYAAVAPTWLRLQTVQSLANMIGVMSIAIGNFGGLIRERLPGAVGVAITSGVLLIGLVVLTVVLRTVQLRRVHRYAAAHPLPV